MVEGFSYPPKLPSRTLTSGKHSRISSEEESVGKPCLFAEVETIGPLKESQSLRTVS